MNDEQVVVIHTVKTGVVPPKVVFSPTWAEEISRRPWLDVSRDDAEFLARLLINNLPAKTFDHLLVLLNEADNSSHD